MADRTLDTARILDWSTFYAICAEVFGFPAFYGSNMNAWIDCLTYIDDGDGMSNVVLDADEYLFVHLLDYENFTARQPDISAALLKCTAFVNRRFLNRGGTPRLCLILV